MLSPLPTQSTQQDVPLHLHGANTEIRRRLRDETVNHGSL